MADVSVVCALVPLATALRFHFGLWGPLHVNGQAPLWIRGAIEPNALADYGPGYFELFGWLVRVVGPPDHAIFTANAVLSGCCPALLYGVARLAGVRRSPAVAIAVALAVDAVLVRIAASETYYVAVATLVLATQAALALFVRCDIRRDLLGSACAVLAAALFAAAAARIVPSSYLPVAISPLVVFGAAGQASWRSRVELTVVAAAVIGATVLFTSGAIVAAVSRSSTWVVSHSASGVPAADWILLIVLAAAMWALRRWTDPRHLVVVGFCSFAILFLTYDTFRTLPIWALSYARLYWPGILLGAAPLMPGRLRSLGWGVAFGAVIGAASLVHALPALRPPTTEQLEYAFLRDVLGNVPSNCRLASVTRAGTRIWEPPSYLLPGASGLEPVRVERPSDLRYAAPGACLVYVRASLCTSAEARASCESVEREIPLERIASRVLPAEPSFVYLPYDRSEVEVVVFRVRDAGRAR